MGKVSLRAMVVVGVLFCAEAHTSGRTEEQTLEQVVTESTAIVVVTPDTPATKTTSVDITPPGKKPSPEYPPFERVATRWIVREVIRGADLKVGDHLEVGPANASYWLEIHKKRYLEGVNKIALIPVYSPMRPIQKDPGSDRVAFLRHTELGYELVARDSLETTGYLPTVKKLVREETGDEAVKSAPPRVAPRKP